MNARSNGRSCSIESSMMPNQIVDHARSVAVGPEKWSTMPGQVVDHARATQINLKVAS